MIWAILPLILITYPYLLARIFHVVIPLYANWVWRIYLISSIIIGASLHFVYTYKKEDWRDLVEDYNKTEVSLCQQMK